MQKNLNTSDIIFVVVSPGDKELVQALILDAKITKVFEEKNSRRDS